MAISSYVLAWGVGAGGERGRETRSFLLIPLGGLNPRDLITLQVRLSTYRFRGDTSVESIAGAFFLAAIPSCVQHGPCDQVPVSRGSWPLLPALRDLSEGFL